MNARKNAVTNPPFRTRECVVIVMTAVVLASLLGFLTTDSFSFLSATPATTGTVGSQPGRMHDSRRDEQGTNSNVKDNAALTRMKETENAKPATNLAKKASVRDGVEIRPAEHARVPHHATPDEAQEPPMRVASAEPHSHAQQPELVFTPSVIGKTVLAIAVIFALAIVAGLIFVFAFFALLRRHTRKFGALIRVEYNGAPPMVVGPYTARSLDVATPSLDAAAQADNHRGGQMAADNVAAHTAKASDFGGSFDLERQLMNAKAQRQDAAVLQQLFEDNLKLQGDIGSAQGKPEFATLSEADIQDK